MMMPEEIQAAALENLLHLPLEVAKVAARDYNKDLPEDVTVSACVLALPEGPGHWRWHWWAAEMALKAEICFSTGDEAGGRVCLAEAFNCADRAGLSTPFATIPEPT